MVPQVFSTKLTEFFGISHPIILSPMLGTSMGKLAGAVAVAGGLGLIGIGTHLANDANVVRQEWKIANDYLKGNPGSKGALGFGFAVPFMEGGINDKSFQAVMELNPPPAAVWLSFGDCGPFADVIHARGIKIVTMVNTVSEAIASKNQGSDVIVVQGSDSGGHGEFLASIVSLVPETVEALGPNFPVVAAGGVVDGRGLACALTLGASGVVLGTRMVATLEATASPQLKQRIITTFDGPSTTVVTQLFDNLGTIPWPKHVFGRALKDNMTIAKFSHHVHDLEFRPSEEDKAWYSKNRNTDGSGVVWCGAAVGLIKSVLPAGDVIKDMVILAKKCILQPQSYKFV